MIRRGAPSSLWISRLPDWTTSLKAPGPGPIRTKDWNAIARQMVDNKGVIFHSDSAKAYVRPFARLVHTRVIHCKKWQNGTWTKPYCTKRLRVKCNKTYKHVIAGTQIIDGVWRLMRKGKWGGHGRERTLDRDIRWVQFKYRKQGRELFNAIGDIIRSSI